MRRREHFLISFQRGLIYSIFPPQTLTKQNVFPAVFWRGCSNISKLLVQAKFTQVQYKSHSLQVRCHVEMQLKLWLYGGKESFYPAGENQQLTTSLRAHMSEGYQVPHNCELIWAYNSSID